MKSASHSLDMLHAQGRSSIIMHAHMEKNANMVNKWKYCMIIMISV